MHVILSGQGVLGFSPSIKNLLPDIQAFAPSVLLVVPRVLEKVYNAASAKAGGGVKGRLFAWSAKQARAYSQAREKAFGPGPLRKMRHGLADSLVLNKIRSVLGPNLRYIVSGGAPLATDLAHFYAGMGITLLQGYGLSETTGPIAVQHIGNNPVGTVGLPLPGNFIKIAKDGEILVRGQSVMPGYYHLPEETAQVMPDGTWFHTGDLGSIDRKGHLTITGRKKELIVTPAERMSHRRSSKTPWRPTHSSPTSSSWATNVPTSARSSPSMRTCCRIGWPSTASPSAPPPRPRTFRRCATP